ncbi:MAG: 1,2-phenylacetyl-CoA epoxidase subunit B [Gemmatimonadaceae bacterium]|nr:1,2-phenylacetyl-CoA epoxidase subunit B [Gemmatimonadaceae bacterium]
MAEARDATGQTPSIDTPAAGANGAAAQGESQWPLWEVFTQKTGGEPHEHAGSVHAADPEMALQNARDVYARRGGVVSLWVVPSIEITASQSEDAGPLFDPGADKVYRHPQFYKIPRGLKGF